MSTYRPIRFAIALWRHCKYDQNQYCKTSSAKYHARVCSSFRTLDEQWQHFDARNRGITRLTVCALLCLGIFFSRFFFPCVLFTILVSAVYGRFRSSMLHDNLLCFQDVNIDSFQFTISFSFLLLSFQRFLSKASAELEEVSGRTYFASVTIQVRYTHTRFLAKRSENRAKSRSGTFTSGALLFGRIIE